MFIKMNKLFIVSSFFLLICCLKFKGCSAQSTQDVCQNIVLALDCSLDPVRKICGTDLVTYNTSCDFAQAHCSDLDLHILYEGECQSFNKPDPICSSLVGVTCPTGVNPVCASDGKTYPDFCHYEQAKCANPNLNLISLGPCPTINPPTTTVSILDLICQSLLGLACPTGLPVVCGSDGNTYTNGCELEKASCRSDSYIKLEYEGAC